MNKFWYDDTPHICADLDGTLAYYDEVNFNPYEVGAPIKSMIQLMRSEMAKGIEVRIFTARAARGNNETDLMYDARMEPVIKFSLANFRKILPIVNYKTFATIAIYDDRAYQVLTNQGVVVRN